MDEILQSLSLELRRGTIVLGVLSQLKKPTYGYSLVKILALGGLPVEANTLYPLLRRLEAQGLLKSEWETKGAKPRKYYATTEQGRITYAALKAQWLSTVENVNKLLEGDDEQRFD